MHRGGRTRGFAAALAAAILSVAAPQAAARGWNLVDIGTLGGANSFGAAVSNSGLVVGCADLATGEAHAFVYSEGALRDLGPGSEIPAGTSCALAVNDAGVVAGRSTTGEVVIWNGAALTRLGVQGSVGGIDGQGVVVGSYRDGTASHAFMFANGTLTTLGDAKAESAATGINAHAQIVGRSNGRAFLYENGVMRDLGTLGGGASGARDVNDLGQVVGMSADANGQPLSFIFDDAMHALPGPGYSSAVAINNRAQVVGSAEGTYGYLLEAGVYTRLDTLPAVVAKGWRHLEPTGINDKGWIVGTATASNGDLRAFLLVPVADRAPVAALARIGRRN